jgi:hypothetical protein
MKLALAELVLVGPCRFGYSWEKVESQPAFVRNPAACQLPLVLSCSATTMNALVQENLVCDSPLHPFLRNPTLRKAPVGVRSGTAADLGMCDLGPKLVLAGVDITRSV